MGKDSPNFVGAHENTYSFMFQLSSHHKHIYIYIYVLDGKHLWWWVFLDCGDAGNIRFFLQLLFVLILRAYTFSLFELQ